MVNTRAIVTSLDEHELDMLQQSYRLATSPSEHRELSINCKDLLDPELAMPFLQKVGAFWETDSMTATVSLFAKRYAYLTIAAGLYAMSRYNKGLDLSLANSSLESYLQGEAWLPKALLVNQETSSPSAGRRDEWRDEIVQQMFAGNLAPVWAALSKMAGVSQAVLWENTAIYVYWLYENQFADGASEEERQQIEADYRYLVHEAPAHLFAQRSNPLKKFDSPKRTTAVSDTPIRVRKTCCLYYLAADEPDDYCPTCPKLKHG
ncbi:IucA/IucC family C-terminal-domain containing protein [Paenibacillus hunanensis]|uniref:IucA/IucC family C-terminal-domain containing protein n=1 Tax=Paenibacillus hunanensis TaxID=539262 RepID=UPI002A6A9AD9|nr:IucA/IucC family C-terminal-domain containing protein [Paenibacillus hunanensis]WPP43514.1 IucA/IucC family C-terminal-domain containing protein [Paenibacillus hunanensis]